MELAKLEWVVRAAAGTVVKLVAKDQRAGLVRAEGMVRCQERKKALGE